MFGFLYEVRNACKLTDPFKHFSSSPPGQTTKHWSIIQLKK